MLTRAMTVLLAAAHDAGDWLQDRIDGRLSPSWSQYDIVIVTRNLVEAARRVEAENRQRVCATEEWLMTPENTLLVADDPALAPLQDLARDTMRLVDRLVREAYREQALSEDQRALLIGTIDHAAMRLEPLVPYLQKCFGKGSPS